MSSREGSSGAPTTMDELAHVLRRYTDSFPGQNPVSTPIQGVGVLRADKPRRSKSHFTFKPSMCVVAQGAKVATFGDKALRYGAGEALIVSVEAPAAGWVREASADRPFLGIGIQLDPPVLREVFSKMESLPPPTGEGIFVTACDAPLADCMLRLMRLVATPKAIPILYPALLREIGYWLLSGPRGGDIAKMTLATGLSEPIVGAIHAIRDRFEEPLRIDDLAAIARLSASAFHRQFKELTSMTPLQYQKQLRLIEARRLMVDEAMRAESAAYKVGYESASQFSREYTRMFGRPPKRDAIAVARAGRSLAH